MEDNKEQEQVKEEAVNNEENTQQVEVPELTEAEQKDAKILELEDRYLRLFSEYENFRKRTIKEKSDLITSSKADTFKILLPILDNFDRALKSISESTDIEGLKTGIELIHTQIVSDLGKSGLVEMDVKEVEFNAEEHEAITNIPAPSEDLKGKIVDVIEKGYVLNEKIIRFPKVIVGN